MSTKKIGKNFNRDGCLGALVAFFCIGQLITAFVLIFFKGRPFDGLVLTILTYLMLGVMYLGAGQKRISDKIDALAMQDRLDRARTGQERLN